MDEKRKKNRWVKSLDEAGLLDDVDSGWTLPDGPVEGSTIQVQGSGGKVRREGTPDGADEDVVFPGLDDLDGLFDARVEDPQKTPVEPEQSPPPRRVYTLSAPPDPGDAASQPNTRESADWAETEPDTGAPGQIPTMNVRGIRVSHGFQPQKPVAGDNTGAIVDKPRRGTDTPFSSGEKKQSKKRTLQPGGSSKKAYTKEQIRVSRTEMHGRYEVGDFSGALKIAEDLLDHEPRDAEALSYAEKCRMTLLEMYESRIGLFDRIPALAIEEREIVWRDLDPMASFVLSRIDGRVNYGDLLDISGLPRFETCRILDQLLQDGIIK